LFDRWRRRGGAPRPIAWLGPEEESLIPPRELWTGPDDPIGHYFRWIWEYLAYLTLVAGLRRDDSVLEIGCGHGRTARGLLFYLRSPGRYVGLDIDRAKIADARQRITARWPTFDFQFADVRNAHYNPSGAVDSEHFVFPFADGEFDVIYAASLYTHLLPPETANYFRECRRVLKPGGRCLFSVFLLDHYRGRGTTTSPNYEFEHPLPGHEGVAVQDVEHPDNAIAYRESVLRRLADDAGFDVAQILPGLWSESPGFAVNEQDLILLRPKP
jgi:SAM-dependent methyltransferase